jgi:hypothetical protein
MTDRIDRIVGGADSVCVLALMDAMGSVLTESGDQREHLLTLAKTSLTESMGKRVYLERVHCKSHLDKMLLQLDAMAPQVPPSIQVDVDALLATSLNDIDLEDENMFSKGDLEQHLTSVGDDMARRYALSGQAFWLERVDYKGQSYLGIGTSSGPHPKFPGQDFNVFCTTSGHRTIKDAGEDLVVFSGGHQLTRGDDRDGRSYFIRFALISTCRTWRFWGSTNKNGVRKDVDALKFNIQLNAEKPKGYAVTRMRGRTVHEAQPQTH